VDRFVGGEWIGETAKQGPTRGAMDQLGQKLGFTTEKSSI
jgi:hypothetical protein